jgi:ABC-type branched-subunit amino acid transport system substrate-binding protein
MPKMRHPGLITQGTEKSMKRILRGLGASALGALALLWVPSLQAQILIGQTAAFSGIVADSVKETASGARLYIDAVNARGGIAGQRIDIVTLDDKFDPKLAGANARKLAEQGVLALFLSRGTPTTEAILPVLAEYKMALVAPSTGAMLLHRPVNPYVFNVRSSYQREAERAIQHLGQVGVKRIAIVRANDSFGADAYVGAMTAFAALGTKPVLDEKFDRTKPDFSAIAPKVKESGAQVVLFLCSGSVLGDGTRAIRKAGSLAQIVTLSNNASTGTIKQMGEYARGTIVSQVFPGERSLASPMVREALELAKAKNIDALSPSMLEGFAAAKVLVEGLRRASPHPTREKIIAALDTLRKFDIGGMEVSYSPANHSGLDFVDLSIVSADGKFRR